MDLRMRPRPGVVLTRSGIYSLSQGLSDPPSSPMSRSCSRQVLGLRSFCAPLEIAWRRTQRVVGKVVGDAGLFFAVASSVTSSVDERYYVAALWPNRVLTRLSNEA